MDDYSWITAEMFGAKLHELCERDGVAKILAVPGVLELVSEAYNNDVLRELDMERAVGIHEDESAPTCKHCNKPVLDDDARTETFTPFDDKCHLWHTDCFERQLRRVLAEHGICEYADSHPLIPSNHLGEFSVYGSRVACSACEAWWIIDLDKATLAIEGDGTCDKDDD